MATTRPKRKNQAATSADPDRLARQPDGSYRSTDGRFGVEQANGSWFVADHEMADDFGQPRVIGPIASLKLAKDAIPRLREGPIPLRRPIKQSKKRKASASASASAPPPKPETWLDRLPADARKRAEKLVRALEREGIPDAEGVAREEIERRGSDPRPLARRILEHRLEALDKGPEVAREAARVLTQAGARTGRDLPGWALVAVEADGTLTDRRIELD